MSYVVPQRRRPGVVTAAGYLLILVAVLLAVNAVISTTTIGPIFEVMRKAYAEAGIPNSDSLVSFLKGATIFVTVLYLLIAVGLGVLAVFDMRGKNAARIVTWVLGGIGVCCLGCTSASGTAGGSFSGSFSQGQRGGPQIDTAELSREIKAAIPAWVGPAQTTIAVVSLLALLAVILLLTLPPANAYFRPPADTGIDQFLAPPGSPPGPPSDTPPAPPFSPPPPQ